MTKSHIYSKNMKFQNHYNCKIIEKMEQEFGWIQNFNTLADKVMKTMSSDEFYE